MDSQQKMFLNPVLCAPWNIHKQNYENPGNFSFVLKAKRNTATKVPNSLLIEKRNENIEMLTRRFPGLKKYEARAALTMSKNKIEKAIVLLEVSKCYHKEVVEKRSDLGYLRQIAINLFFNHIEQDLSIRNVTLEHSVNFKEQNSSNDKEGVHQDVSSTTSKEKIGVIIKKTAKGYKATAFDKK